MRAYPFLVVVCACGATQLGIANYEDPRTTGANVHQHNDDTIDLPDDESATEPEHPMVQTVQERATAHVHTPKDVCSGTVIGPREVLTAHQCLADITGVAAVNDDNAWRVEIASTTLTWTARHVRFVVTPACEWKKLDAAILVLDEAVDWIVPLRASTAPPPGAAIQAMGFGRCKGEHRPAAQRIGPLAERQSDALQVEIGLCQGDVGGAFVDAAGGLLAVISHQDDPDNADKHTTTGFRIDTPAARRLFEVGEAVAKGNAKATPSTCD